MSTQDKIDKFTKIKELSAELVKNYKKVQRLNIIECDTENCTQKRRMNARSTINFDMIDNDRIEHEIHCLMVELGLAEVDMDRYGYKTFSPSGFNTQRHMRRYPDGVKAPELEKF